MTTVILTEERLQTLDLIVKELPFKYAHQLVNVLASWYQEAREMEQQHYDNKAKQEAEQIKQATLSGEPVELGPMADNTPFPKSRHG